MSAEKGAAGQLTGGLARICLQLQLDPSGFDRQSHAVELALPSPWLLLQRPSHAAALDRANERLRSLIITCLDATEPPCGPNDWLDRLHRVGHVSSSKAGESALGLAMHSLEQKIRHAWGSGRKGQAMPNGWWSSARHVGSRAGSPVVAVVVATERLNLNAPPCDSTTRALIRVVAVSSSFSTGVALALAWT